MQHRRSSSSIHHFHLCIFCLFPCLMNRRTASRECPACNAPTPTTPTPRHTRAGVASTMSFNAVLVAIYSLMGLAYFAYAGPLDAAFDWARADKLPIDIDVNLPWLPCKCDLLLLLSSDSIFFWLGFRRTLFCRLGFGCVCCMRQLLCTLCQRSDCQFLWLNCVALHIWRALSALHACRWVFVADTQPSHSRHRGFPSIFDCTI